MQNSISNPHWVLSYILSVYLLWITNLVLTGIFLSDVLKVLLACFRGLPILPIIPYNPQLVHKDLSLLRWVQFLATECHKLLLLAQHQTDLGLYTQGLLKDLGLVRCNHQILPSLHHCKQLWFLLLHHQPCKQSIPQMYLVISKTKLDFP